MTPLVLVLVAVTAAALALLYAAFALRWRAPREPDGWLEVTANDGHPIALAHFRARAVDARAREPVILCHGVSVNRSMVDLDDDTSLARDLAGRGFEVYALDLRGRGRSRRLGLSGLMPRHTFDDYVTRDLPAAIAAVRGRHGAERVHWVGHSMGGLVLYALLGRDPSVAIRSLVTIASPLRVRAPWWLNLGMRVVGALRLPVCWGHASFLAAPFVGWVHHPPLRMLLNPANVRGPRLRLATATIVADISNGEVRHFFSMSNTGRFGSADGAHDYAAGLARVSTPCLVIAGADDRLATPEAVRAGYDLLGGPREFRLFGRASGDPVDFGHGDLLIGDHARAVVFPEVARWLEGYDVALAAAAPPDEVGSSTNERSSSSERCA